ncbi:Pentatricopeptide repeat-containing protein At4g39620, chloroplastic [Linum grandiflorum]
MALFQISPLHSPFTLHTGSTHNLKRPLLRRRRLQLQFCVACISTAKTKPKRKFTPDSDKAEAEDLVRSIMKSFTEKESLLKTLSKYVRIVRTQHCFMLFEELGRKGKWLQCLEVFRWMQKQRWYIADNGVYSKLISVMGKHSQIRMAMWLFSEMRNSGCRPDTSVYNSLISAHLHSRDKSKALAKALGYFDKMKALERCKPNVVTYNILLRACALARHVDRVNDMFKELETSTTVSPDIYTYNGVMDAYGKNGMIGEMESVLSLMKTNCCKPDIITFNLLIDAYGRKQQFAKMEQVFQSLMQSKEKPTLPTFNSMIINYGKARQRDRAQDVLKKMNDLKYTPSFITYESLITTYGFCDCITKAREVFDSMVESGKEVRASTLNAMLDVYCMNKLHNEAQALVESARGLGVSPDSSSYKLLYKAYTKANNKELVQKLLKRMEKEGIVVQDSKFFLDALGDSQSSLQQGSGSNKAAKRSRNSQNAIQSLKKTGSEFRKLTTSPVKTHNPVKENLNGT